MNPKIWELKLKDLQVKIQEQETQKKNKMKIKSQWGLRSQDTFEKKNNLLMSSYSSFNRNVLNKIHVQTRVFHLQFSEYDNDVENQESIKELSVL